MNKLLFISLFFSIFSLNATENEQYLDCINMAQLASLNTNNRFNGEKLRQREQEKEYDLNCIRTAHMLSFADASNVHLLNSHSPAWKHVISMN